MSARTVLVVPSAMKLSELQPKFLVIVRSNVQRLEVDDFDGAQGVMFLCPRCCSGSRPVWIQHSVVCWFSDREVPDTEIPTWYRWPAHGAGYDDLTIDGQIRVRGGCRWSGWIHGGQLRPLVAAPAVGAVDLAGWNA